MQKRCFLGILAGSMVWLLAACSAETDMLAGTGVYTQQEDCSFTGQVIEVYDGSFLIQVDEGEAERRSSDLITVPRKTEGGGEPADLAVGDRLRIRYDGVLAESYPAQIHTVYEIAVIG